VRNLHDKITLIRYRLNGAEHVARGRAAWALQQLIAAGEKGCTPIDQPAPRWSHYTWLLRGDGIVIDTIHESHGGAYAGHHARYVLRSVIDVIEIQTAADGQAVAA
jgi:hypothetical protein